MCIDPGDLLLVALKKKPPVLFSTELVAQGILCRLAIQGRTLSLITPRNRSQKGGFFPIAGGEALAQNGTALPTVDNLIVLAALLNVRIDDILVTTVA